MHSVVVLTGARQVGYGDTAAMRQFLSTYPQASGGLIVYQGRVVRHLSEKIVAIPWTLLTG